MEELDAFLDSHPDAREYKRALAVKMALQGYAYLQIMSLLKVSAAFISKWKGTFLMMGVEGLKLGYQGSKGYLNPEQRQEVLTWLKQKNYWNVDELAEFILENYKVEFQGRQSYRTLLSEAGIVWKKAQALNPKKDERLVALKKKSLPKGFRSGVQK